jgi:RNA polymerase sigma-70 factor (ECF subfamily)
MDARGELAINDELAIKKAQRGDHDAFRSLVEHHTQAVFRLAWRITGNTIDAEDMVQETFLRAWKQLGKFDGRAAFGTWVHRIAANCSLDHIRSRKGKAEAADDPLARDPLMNVAHGGPSPERLAQSAEITGLLIPALDELTEMERAAFILRHYEGLPILEISRVLGVEAGAAKHSVFRAVQKLRRALEPAVSGLR